MNIYEKLLKIQTELKAPKSQFNSFGKYNYRSCEDILEGLKPLLEECKATLVVNDEIVQIGDRYYVMATATLIDIEGNESLTKGRESISATAYAREDEKKSGMDLSQLTGSTSSYARKYALSGLFAIDDTKDSDATNKHEKSEGNKNKSESNKEVKESNLRCSSCGIDINQAVSAFSKNKFGKELCRDCQAKENK